MTEAEEKEKITVSFTGRKDDIGKEYRKGFSKMTFVDEKKRMKKTPSNSSSLAT
jgi:hypothetical protein